jgi:aminopeptidase-like protein
MIPEPDTQPSIEGEWMHDLARRLWPLHRSITGDGLRESLRILAEELPGLTITEVPSGTKVFDWVVPPEWQIRSATLTGPNGEIVINYQDCNLHVVGYSEPVDLVISLEELQSHLHSIPDQPTAIPYVTSYYNRTWGLCLSQEQRDTLQPGEYHVVIDSEFSEGSLTYAELLIPGESTSEIFISTYVCHPSMANNELSGPVVAAALANYVQSLQSRHYSYRFVFAPETIGAIAYAKNNLVELQRNVVAAFNLTCIGDDRATSYLASRNGNLRVDRVAKRVVASRSNPRFFSYLDRGSDERHYGAPGVDLPMVSLMRSRYADYPEYHTSLDDLVNVVTRTGLQGGFDIAKECIDIYESELVLTATQFGEPQLGRRGLYHLIQKKSTPDDVMLRTNILAYADGHHSMVDMAELFERPIDQIRFMVDELVDHDLLRMDFESTPAPWSLNQ